MGRWLAIRRRHNCVTVPVLVFDNEISPGAKLITGKHLNGYGIGICVERRTELREYWEV